MRCPRIPIGWLGVSVGMVWASAGAAPPPAPVTPCGLFAEKNPGKSAALARVPLQELPAEVREPVRRVVEQPTLFSQGPTEDFAGRSELYEWFLDHPDRAAVAWRRLGAPCLEIADQGGGFFSWSDGQGTNVRWETVFRGVGLRVWYAEGSGRPAPLLPSVPLRAVVVLRHGERHDAAGRCRLSHQADLFLQTDSKTAALVARLLGPSVPRLAEQGLSQLELFFSALVWYLDQHPDRAESLLAAHEPLTLPPAR